MSHKFDPSDKDKLDNEWRRQNLPPYDTLKQLGLTENDIVADIGCGIGYLTIPISETIKPTNKVYALDTSEDMLLEVERRAKFAEVKNIICLKTAEYDLKLNDKMVSFSLLVNVLHEIDYKYRFIKEIKRITKSNGRIAIIEWLKKQTENGLAVEDRIDKNEVRMILETIGFSDINEINFTDCFYGIVGILK